MLPKRHGSTDTYRYGFNGKEKDDEVKGEGVQYDYGFRIYDARLGRFLSMDPLFRGFPYYTPYQFAGNKPIWAIDLDGLEEFTKTRTRVYLLEYVVTYGGKKLDGTYTFYSQSDKRKKVVISGQKTLINEGSEGGAIMIREKHYQFNWDVAKKDGLRVYKTVVSKYYGTGKFVPADPNNHNKQIDDVEEIKTSTPLDPPNKDDVIKKVPKKAEPKKPIVTEEPPKDIVESKEVVKVTNVRLKVEFVPNRKKFKDQNKASEILTPILNKLLENSDNSVRLSPNTLMKKDFDYLDLGGILGDGDTSTDLVRLRGQTIKDWFTSRGVNPSQITIDTNDSYEKSIDVTGELKTIEKQ